MNTPHINTEALWLVSWYPNVLAPFDGDFIQRHAKAVSRCKKITVIYIKKDEDATVTKGVSRFISSSNNLTEIIVYYHSVKTGFALMDKFLSVIKHKKTYRSAINEYLSEKGVPAVVHVHVALKAGIQALWLKQKYNVPFIVSEHWTGYLPDARFGLNNVSPVQRRLAQKIFNRAQKITVVSEVLGKAISAHFGARDYTVVPNVVDTSVFFPEDHTKNSPVTFIHISSLEYQKNISAILTALSLVKAKGYNFRFMIYGPPKKELLQMIDKSGLQESVQVEGEVPQYQLASRLKMCDALILYSRYETFGCVVIEANACGVPAILSDLPVFREYMVANENGIFVIPDDPVALAETLGAFISGKYFFDKKTISEQTTRKFNYDVVGRQFCDLYEAL